MDSLTFTIDLKDLDNTDFDQLTNDIQAFINILHHASPDYAVTGNVLQMQLDEQVKKHKEEIADPREKFREKLDEMCPYRMEAILDTDLKDLYAELKSEIGEAMGPVSYAAFKLAQEFKKRNCSAGCNWIWDFIEYYEEHWEF